MTRIDEILLKGAQLSLHGTALISKGGAFTYEQLDARVSQLAGALCARGVEKGDIVALTSKNAPIFIELTMACSRIGAVCAAFSTRFSCAVLSTLIAHAAPRLLFVPEDKLADAQAAVRGAQVETECFASEGAAYEALLASAPAPRVAELEETDPALLLYTSGTTGTPKGVVLSHGALLARIEIDRQTMHINEHTKMLFVLPFFHVTCVSVFVVLASGGAVAIASGAKDYMIVSEIQKNQATHVGLLPYHLRQLVGYLERTKEQLSSLELVAYGGEPMDADTLHKCRKLIPCMFWQGYGMTETASSIAVVTPEDHATDFCGTTVGRAVPLVEICICADDGTILPTGKVGEVWVKTPTIMNGYFNNPEQTAKVMRNGWYLTGDIGWLSVDGHLTLIDRKNEMFISGGENVYPSEIAACIRKFAGVADVVVERVSDERWGESAVAFIEPNADIKLDPQEISDWCATALGHYKRPKKVVIVDSLQRKETGKVPREYLLSLLEK